MEIALMGQTKYRATEYSKNWLAKNGFVFSKAFSDADNPVYIRRESILRWSTMFTLEAEIRVSHKNGAVAIDIYDGPNIMTRSKFAPFYYEPGYDDYLHNECLDKIHKKLAKLCSSLGFVKENGN